MLEGLVRQLLQGYLGGYVKDFQKEQLKITFWNEEVLLENVELILEAFDYLQLPFALKQGRIGKLCIKIPWKKLVLDPIVIILEDVFVCASQRDEKEWSLDAVEKREFAGKKAQLAAAELAKLSRRVCENQTAQSFVSYITAKILDSIQVSIRNFHVQYSDVQSKSIQVMCGLKFSSLMIMKHNPVGSSLGKLRGSQVNKVVEIKGLEIYCSPFEGVSNVMISESSGDSNTLSNSKFEGNNVDHLVDPFDLSISLLVNKSGNSDNDMPQYSISAEIVSLVMSLNEVQLQQILIISDYLCTSRLREKYWRYHPCCSPLSRKPDGWQKMLWHFAQESVLSDVRQRLKKTSWRYFGKKLSYRRKYVNLYKTKLDFLRQEQSIDEYILRELEQMEKESDIDDILSYRSAAEHELQEVLSSSSPLNIGVNGSNIPMEKSQNDEHSSGRSQGWLNWLSRGVLGAGGTDDSSQFSGVVSDEVVKDIYEATEFHPTNLSSGSHDYSNDKMCACAIKFSIEQISATLRNDETDEEVAKLILEEAAIEFKLWGELATITASINSGEMVNPCNKNVRLLKMGSFVDKDVPEYEQFSCKVQVDVSRKLEVELGVKVMLQPLEVICDMEFFLNVIDFFAVLRSFEFHNERVLSSLNGIDDVKARLLTKAEYVLSNHKKVVWDVSIINITIDVPWEDATLHNYCLVFELGSLRFTSEFDVASLASTVNEQSSVLKHSISAHSFLMGFELQDLYNHFEVKLDNFEMKLKIPSHLGTISVLERFCSSITLASCIIPDESVLKQLEVCMVVSSLRANFSPSIYDSVVAVVSYLQVIHSRAKPLRIRSHALHKIASDCSGAHSFHLTITAKLELFSIHVDLANDEENSSSLILVLQNSDIWYSFKDCDECWLCVKGLKIAACPLRSELGSQTLFLSGNQLASSSIHGKYMGVGLGDQTDDFVDRNACGEACFLLHYEAPKMAGLGSHKLTVCLNDSDLHCYPYIFRLLNGFFIRLYSNGATCAGEKSQITVDTEKSKTVPGFNFERFGFSNFFETGSSDSSTIPLSSYPFVSIRNSGSLSSLDSSLLYSIYDWRKLFSMRESKVRSPKCTSKKESKSAHASPLKSTSNMFVVPASGSFGDANICIDINLSGIKVHFHDSSCIVGTIVLPATKSSVLFNDDSMDLLCSVEGLILTTSWWTKNFHEFLWGPSLPNLSPILNVRVKKGNAQSSSSQLEINISIQHVCCILPPEYLAIIIGYFSLPDWSAEQHVKEMHGQTSTENRSVAMYKFEILDSTLMLPVESHDGQFVKIEMKHMYCSFIDTCLSKDLLFDIPSENMVPLTKISEQSHCLNIFGQDLFVSLLVFERNGYDCFIFDKCRNVTLFAPLSADVWVRIPCENESLRGSSSVATCIMLKVYNVQLIADDFYIFNGLEALLDVIDQFSSVNDKSQSYTSDVLQFLQLKRCPSEYDAAPSLALGIFLTEVRCSVDHLSIKLHSLRDDLVLLKPVAEANMQFRCSASLMNELPISMDFSFSALALYSLLNPILLARCVAACSSSLVLDISFSKFDQKKNEFCFSIPSLEFWLHVLEWTEVMNFCTSCAKKLANIYTVDIPSKSSPLEMVGSIDTAVAVSHQSSLQNPSTSPHCVSENLKEDTIILVKSENMAITMYFPVCLSKEPEGEFAVAGVQDEKPQPFSSNLSEGRHCKYIAVATHTRNSELLVTGRNAKLNSTLESLSGTVEIFEGKNGNSWPFFQIFRVNLDTEVQSDQSELVKVKMGIQCDRLDFSLSHQVFYFWHGVEFNIPQAGSSQSIYDSMDINLQLRRFSLLISDGRWSSGGPLLEILLRNFHLHASAAGNCLESLVTSELEVNYNNIHKVLWESFIEPCKFEISMTRKQETAALMNSSMNTDISITSMAQLNLNFTESLIECVFRTIDMVQDAWSLVGPKDLPENQRLLNPQLMENICEGRYAPYVFQNLTSLPLVYYVFHGMVTSSEFDISEMKDGKSVQPGASISIYLNDTPEEQLFRYRPGYSSERLGDMQPNGVAHHFMSIQLDGTSVPSTPISMDLVGLTYFEVDFSKASKKVEIDGAVDTSKYTMNIEENGRADTDSGFVAPVVFDVSVQRHSKLIRLYSTVMLLNSTSVPLELRFDIPFGVSPKILDPIYPGQEFPLPLHLAEAGRMRWRPLGASYLWSEAHYLSDILMHESKIGFLRSFVCYPSHPSSDPFRCCMSVQNICFSDGPEKASPLCVDGTFKQSVESGNKLLHDLDKSKKRSIHRVTLSTPLIVNNYLPEEVSLKVESGGVTRTALLSEVENSFHHIDPSHDLGLEFKIYGFDPSVLKFPRTETFSAAAKFSGTKFSLSETIAFHSDLSNGPTYATVEKTMDAFSGARELFIFVPFLLYNCSGFPLKISDASSTVKETGCTITSCYDLIEHELLHSKKDGLSLLASEQNLHASAVQMDGLGCSFSDGRMISTRKIVGNTFISSGSSKIQGKQKRIDLGEGSSLNTVKNSFSSSKSTSRDSDVLGNEHGRVKACMYSPAPISSVREIMVQVSRTMPNSSWSEPFPLVPPSGSTSILVPQSLTNAAFVISVTSNALAGCFDGRTQAITFQPRYVISNACSKDLCYRQKGTDNLFHLGIGQHAHLHWTDITRELLVSVRFDGPGWQWSGSFLPDHLCDTQVKMRNYVYGVLNMVRVEVQNADVSIRDEKIVGSLSGNSGTNLILLSDDDTGYMPYRIDNFSKERLRIYQQRCENFDSIIHSYTSCSYAWDEPCNPHRLIVEVPGERVIGSYALDDLKEHVPVHLPSTSEKPERTLLISVKAEGATKVLSIIDSSYHVLKDMKDNSSPWFKEKRKHEHKQEEFVGYKERLLITIPQIGVSLINSFPKELVFACAQNITVDLLQSMDQQKIYFQISSLQIDNQLPTTPYPVILSFDHDHRSNLAGHRARDGHTKFKSEVIPQITCDNSCEPVFNLAVAIWRKKDSSLFSFQYIRLRVANIRLELEQDVILSLLDFYKTVSSRFQDSILPLSDPTMHRLFYDVDFSKENSANALSREHVKAMDHQLNYINVAPVGGGHISNASLPSVVPIGAPWQQIYVLARRQKKIYVELFDLGPVKITLSFSSSPWMLRNGILTSGESLIHRGLMAVADIEGARIHLKQLIITHHMASWESIQEILIRHYTWQLLHEMYKVFGSAGVIGNPMGFARSVGLGVRDFLSLPAKSFLRSPTGLITGVAQGTTSLVSNTVYALSDAATQFSKAAHKGIVAFTFDDQSVGRMEKPQKGLASHSKGVINEVLEGLTGLLQSPIKEAEKHGLPGVLSGIALGVTGLVARPAASILEVTGKTAQSIRNRSSLYQAGSQCYRVRLPRPLSRELPLRPYTWEEAVGTSVIVEADDGLKLKDELLILCKTLKQAGKFVVITERLMLIVSCSSLVDLGKPEFRGVPVDPEWVIDSEIGLDSVIHADTDEEVVNIVGSGSDTGLRQNQQHPKKGSGTRTKRWNHPSTPLPLFQTNLELTSKEEAEILLRTLLSTIDQGKARGWGCRHILHQTNIK
ncbi:putative vacuolar protein sorting-associated protein 13B-like isoform X3 [Tripterygium wilfordii]|uniref:Putative vacuolar protein sorting-associated protein 13B-like isoform X3 n=1 Tax=Tripterygium wilfordii TaxID=458696 RepID=A0A7J7DRF0_TRIWF|nr:uncharacterized protein LOC119997199 isoform X2 [Tripterygium wilfordii]KAF5748859.1 putative vacuolar protein sorting-associated protein 13B-like isoform X3 [Tripterygium wilfordii]